MPRPKAIRQRINYLRNKDIEKAPVAKTREQIGTQVKTIKTEF